MVILEPWNTSTRKKVQQPPESLQYSGEGQQTSASHIRQDRAWTDSLFDSWVYLYGMDAIR